MKASKRLCLTALKPSLTVLRLNLRTGNVVVGSNQGRRAAIGTKVVFKNKKNAANAFNSPFSTQAMHIKSFYAQQQCYVSLKTLYLGGI
jgi:hypothetical protein